MKGKLITFEGIEGCGKSTQVGLVHRALSERGVSAILTREPGGTEIGSQIRRILLDPRHGSLTPVAELLLYAADRAQHIREKIVPALGQGKVLLCDRFTDATLAYQGYGRGLDPGLITKLNRIATGGCVPDRTILIDLPVKIGLDRANQRNRANGVTGTEGRFEEEEIAFHNRVREGYLSLAARDPERIRVVRGDQSPDRTCREILSFILPLLSE